MQKSKLPVWLFYGEEEFLIEEKIKEFKRRIVNPELNIEYLDGDELTLEAFSSAVASQSLLGGDKLVIVSDPKLPPETQAGFLSLLGGVGGDCTVIFKADSVDKRTKFYKLINDRGESVEFRSFAPWEQPALAAWLKARAAAEKKQLSEAAARLLPAICGTSLRVLAGEITKLATYVGDKTTIDEDDVLAAAAAGEMSGFALLDALRAKDLPTALIIFQQLLKFGEELLPLLILLATQYRLLLQIKAAPGRERDPNRLARLIGGSPYFIKKSLDHIDDFSLAELKDALKKILQANLEMKSSRPPLIVMELLIAALCGRTR